MRMGDYFNVNSVPLAFRPEIVMGTKRTKELLQSKSNGKLNRDIYDVSDNYNDSAE